MSPLSYHGTLHFGAGRTAITSGVPLIATPEREFSPQKEIWHSMNVSQPRSSSSSTSSFVRSVYLVFRLAESKSLGILTQALVIPLELRGPEAVLLAGKRSGNQATYRYGSVLGLVRP